MDKHLETLIRKLFRIRKETKARELERRKHHDFMDKENTNHG